MQLFCSADIQRFLKRNTEVFNEAKKESDLALAREGYFEFFEFNIVLSVLYIIVFFCGIAG